MTWCSDLVSTTPGETVGLVARANDGRLRIDVAGRRPVAELATVHEEAAAGRLAGRTILIP
ncbi:hypothetical protein [Actinoplanes sp. NPDC051851]|uniref:hypothetical protein n=1 Tax=Actinoplanes sp. NPDC051851 TaxID=3154753 RepID=UPI0034168EF8